MTIFIVFNKEEYVGTFFCAAYSTREKAEECIRESELERSDLDLSIVEYEIDSE